MLIYQSCLLFCFFNLFLSVCPHATLNMPDPVFFLSIEVFLPTAPQGTSRGVGPTSASRQGHPVPSMGQGNGCPNAGIPTLSQLRAQCPREKQSP